MEGYPYSNCPESGDSSPHCREIDGENTISWDETPQPVAARVKLMCSYGGRIQPRPHDNQLSYFGGETKILAVERSIRFPGFITKLASLHGKASPDGICIKYQLPGEDLDALISVTNDEDLDHMMIEYDRIHLCSGKPAARLRLFLFPAIPSIGSNVAAVQAEKMSDRAWLLEALLPEQSAPILDHSPLQSPPTPLPTLVPDFLSGILHQACVEAKDLSPENLVAEPLTIDALPLKSEHGKEETQQIAGETVVSPSLEVQRQIQVNQGMQIAENQYHSQASTQRNDSDEALARVYHGEYYASGDKVSLAPAPAGTLAPAPNATTQIPAAYWADQHGIGGRFTSVAGGDQVPVYLIPASHSLYPSTAGHAYYTAGHPPPMTFSRVVPTDAYREMSALYAMAPPPQPPAKMAVPQYPDGSALLAPAMDAAMAAAYAATQVAYDSTGRPVFYPGGIATYPAGTSVALKTEPNMTNSSQVSSQL